MKLTTETLRKIIQEEIEEALKIQKRPRKNPMAGDTVSPDENPLAGPTASPENPLAGPTASPADEPVNPNFKGIKFPKKIKKKPTPGRKLTPAQAKAALKRGIDRSRAKKAGKIAGDDYSDRLRSAGLYEEDVAALEEQIYKILVDKINGGNE